MHVRTATNVGQVRENNEDSLLVRDHLLVVCDGMGGHLAGEVASQIAIEAIRAFPFHGIDSASEVIQAIEQAQNQILEMAQAHADYHGMGTTVTLAWLEPRNNGGAKLTIGHVGDSRAYVFSKGDLRQVTRDHSIVGELVRSGTITPDEARTHGKRHVLTQALGSLEIEIELVQEELEPDSFVLLCTDGLTDVVEDGQIQAVLEGESATMAQDLVDLANSLGGPDNITVILAKV